MARKAIENLSADIRYPSLKVKKIKEIRNIWEARVCRSIRINFQIGTDSIILRNIGQHDEAPRDKNDDLQQSNTQRTNYSACLYTQKHGNRKRRSDRN
jgi:hypothetical protein